MLLGGPRTLLKATWFSLRCCVSPHSPFSPVVGARPIELFYTCGIDLDDVTRGDEMTRGRDDQGTK
jgi:hypothetical protein